MCTASLPHTCRKAHSPKADYHVPTIIRTYTKPLCPFWQTMCNTTSLLQQYIYSICPSGNYFLEPCLCTRNVLSVCCIYYTITRQRRTSPGSNDLSLNGIDLYFITHYLILDYEAAMAWPRLLFVWRESLHVLTWSKTKVFLSAMGIIQYTV